MSKLWFAIRETGPHSNVGSDEVLDRAGGSALVACQKRPFTDNLFARNLLKDILVIEDFATRGSPQMYRFLEIPLMAICLRTCWSQNQ